MKTINIMSVWLVATATLIAGCHAGDDKADGYGNFESTEITVSSEANGNILAFRLGEGDRLSKGQAVGHIDTTQLYLQKAQLTASRKAVVARSAGVLSQINVYEAQQKTLQTEKERVTNLLRDSAATQKQLDDITGQLNVLEKQINSVRVQNAAVFADLESMDAQLRQLSDQVAKSIITNPVNGTVLVKYAEEGEVAAFGKPLYKMADLTNMILRVYVGETQLAGLAIGDTVKVKIDEKDGTGELPGVVTWISSTAEFTPKIIQTKEERVNLVYAVKVTVKNDGRLKIGMPGEMWVNAD